MKILLKKAASILGQSNWFYLLVITLFFYAVACYARTKSIDVPIFHLDGAFQTASGLFRLLQGELPGKDFYPYLGVGPIGLIYPIFLIGGADLCASVMASYFIVYAADILSIAILIHLIWQQKNFLLSLAAACGLFALPQLLILDASYFFGMLQLPEWISLMTGPGNSLRPLRSLIPYLAIFSAYFFIIPEKYIPYKFFAYGMTMGIISLWSNDYALLTAIAVFFLVINNFIKDTHYGVFKTLGCLILISVLSMVLMQTLVTGGHPLKLAKYNFVDVAKDQWWYFGYWIEAAKVFSPKEVTKILPEIRDPLSFYVLGIVFLSLFFIKGLRRELLFIFVIGLLSIAGGTVASIGGHIMTNYFDGFKYWARVVVVLFVCRGAHGLISILLAERIQSILSVIGKCICLVIVSVYAIYAAQHLSGLKASRSSLATYLYVPELGGYLEKNWAEYIDYIRAHQDKTTIEEYFGIWSAMLKKPSIWPVDSSIHALGEVRQVAAQALQEKAEIVVTSDRKIANEWLGWNVSANYWFYKTLFNSYTPHFYSPTTIVWKKNRKNEIQKNIDCKINNTGNGIILQAPASGYYEVELSVDIHPLNNNRYIVMFENNINFSMLEMGAISISPYDKNQLLPVYIPEKGEHEFGFLVRPLNAVELVVEKCSAKEILLKNERILVMSEGENKIYDNEANTGSIYGNYAFWDRGISKSTPGFFVFKDKKSLNKFKIGGVVKLPTGEKRTIASLAGSAMYLEVYLEGDMLIPDKVGLPSEFEVLPHVDDIK